MLLVRFEYIITRVSMHRIKTFLKVARSRVEFSDKLIVWRLLGCYAMWLL
jgi:hypothetical protein